MFCKNCGGQIEPTFKFCNQCGYPLTESENTLTPESITPAQVYITEDTTKKKHKKTNIFIVLILFLLISVASVIMLLISDSNDADTVLPQTSNTNQEVEIQETTETTTANISSDIPVIFNALEYNSTTTINEIMTDYPGGQLEDGIYLTDTSADLKRYLYKNFSFNFADGKLQSIFMDYEIALYTDEKNCPGEPYVCNSTDEFLPLFGLSGGQISDSGYLYIADNCGIYEFICFHNGANIENVEICYTDLILYYN